MSEQPPVVVEHLADDIHIAEFTVDWLADAPVIESVRSALEDVCDHAEKPKLIIDMGALTQVSSQMLSVLIDLDRQTKAKAGGMRLAAIPHGIAEVLRLTKLDEHFSTHETAAEARKAFERE